MFGLVGTKPDVACGAGATGSAGAEYRGDPAIVIWKVGDYDRKTVKRNGNRSKHKRIQGGRPLCGRWGVRS
jgi:hypothetical protein